MDNVNVGGEMPAVFNTALSIFSASFSLLTIQQVQAGVTLAASIIACISGIFAIRYYYYATKSKKKRA
jgi:hypothetical protein